MAFDAIQSARTTVHASELKVEAAKPNGVSVGLVDKPGHVLAVYVEKTVAAIAAVRREHRADG